MADTITPIEITDEWVNMNTLSGITAGTATKIQNVGGVTALFRTSATQPTETTGEGVYVAEIYTVNAGENAVWMRARPSGTKTLISFQVKL